MKAPEIPDNESARLRSLRASGLVGSAPSERFDRITRLARHLFGTKYALLSLVDATNLWLQSCAGWERGNPARETSFCGHAILGFSPMVVEDALKDERFFDNPMVLGPPNLRFYAGCPVRSPDGYAIGSLCLADDRPHTLTTTQITILQDLAAIVEDEFAVLNHSIRDELTGLSNRRGFNMLGNYALLSGKRRGEPLSLGYIDLDYFKEINDTWGHSAGDSALVAMAQLMKQSFRDADVISRQGGDEFSVLFIDSDADGAGLAMQALHDKVDEYNCSTGNPWRLQFSWGVEEFNPGRHETLEALINAADSSMYRMKKTRHGVRE